MSGLFLCIGSRADIRTLRSPDCSLSSICVMQHLLCTLDPSHHVVLELRLSEFTQKCEFGVIEPYGRTAKYWRVRNEFMFRKHLFPQTPAREAQSCKPSLKSTRKHKLGTQSQHLLGGTNLDVHLSSAQNPCNKASNDLRSLAKTCFERENIDCAERQVTNEFHNSYFGSVQIGTGFRESGNIKFAVDGVSV